MIPGLLPGERFVVTSIAADARGNNSWRYALVMCEATVRPPMDRTVPMGLCSQHRGTLVTRHTLYWKGASSPRCQALAIADDEKPALRSWPLVASPNCLRLSDERECCLVRMVRSILCADVDFCDLRHTDA